MALQSTSWNSLEDLIHKYETRGPRYTSYPTAPVWTEAFKEQDYRDALKQTNQHGNKPLSLYTHLPFCANRCLYCSCNVVITRKEDQAELYLGYLFREMYRVASSTHFDRQISQLHWGGGTPTYLSSEQLARLFHMQTQLFPLRQDAEISIEIDPRVTSFDQLQTLRELGFNRVSLGVQDFDSKVQASVRRIQPVDLTTEQVDECRRLGFHSINFDLIYGLPHQTVSSFRKTLDTVIQLKPDRIALYNYAHVPWISPHQKYIDETTLPCAQEKIQIFLLALDKLQSAGYVYIGMDHFARSTDTLTTAMKKGKLNRNFMGYTTQPNTDLYGLGVSAIGGFDRFYAQNDKKLSTYYQAIDSNQLATQRGYVLSKDDCIRKSIILDILCHSEIRIHDIETEFGISFKEYFFSELERLRPLESDGLVCKTSYGYSVTALGRILSRNIAMVFDKYLSNDIASKFSKTV